MMAIWDPDEAYYMWRSMLDGRYQNLGYGRRGVAWRGVAFAITRIRQHNLEAKQLGVMSTPPEGKTSANPLNIVKPEDKPYKFHQKLGVSRNCAAR
jgi:diamine N-acetyltransferase